MRIVAMRKEATKAWSILAIGLQSSKTSPVCRWETTLRLTLTDWIYGAQFVKAMAFMKRSAIPFTIWNLWMPPIIRKD